MSASRNKSFQMNRNELGRTQKEVVVEYS